MNNPDDIKILKEIYSEHGIVMEEEKPKQQSEENNVSFEDLQSLLTARKGELDQNQINKLFKLISKTGKGYTSTLLSILKQKGLGAQQALAVAGYADKDNFEDTLLSSVQNAKNTFNKLPTEGNLVTVLSAASNIEAKHINNLVNLTVGAGQKSVGKGELALISVLYDTTSPTKGDVATPDALIELKFVDAILANPKHISRGLTAEQLRKVMVDTLQVPEQDQQIITGGKAAEWLPRLLRYTQDLSKIQKVLDRLYKGNVKLPNDIEVSNESVTYEIARQLAKDYMDHIDQKLMAIGTSYDYKTYNTSDQLVADIGSQGRLTITKFSDLTPRLTYVG
jgi:hypothetical protein